MTPRLFTKPLLDVINGKHSKWQVYNDWIDIILTSLAEDDSAYLDVAETYTKEELTLFSEAFAELLLSTRTHEVDVLGDVYEALGANSKEFGQFFTPHTVADAMAEIQTGIEPSETDDGVRITDPACGSGRLIIASAQHVDEGYFHGVDKDEVCAKMCAINFYLFNLEGYVVHGDSLSMTCYRGWQTKQTESGFRVREVPDPSFELG